MARVCRARLQWLSVAVLLVSLSHCREEEPAQGYLCGIDQQERVVEQYCNYSARECTLFLNCCATSGYPAERSSCERAVTRDCRNFVHAQLAAGRCFDAALSAATQDDCDARFLELVESCEVPARSVLLPGLRETCPDVWPSTRPPGANCRPFAGDCAAEPGTVASCEEIDIYYDGEREITLSVGKCVSDPRAEPGEPCGYDSDGTYHGCGSGYVCHALEHRCALPASDGSACGADGDCQNLICREGTCRAAEGETCTDDFDCGSGRCSEGICTLSPVVSEAFCAFDVTEVLLECSDTCSSARDGICDDGGIGAEPASFCELSTDCSDCGGR